LILFHCHPLPKGVFERNMPGTGFDGTAGELVRCAHEMGFSRAVVFAPDLVADDAPYGVTCDPNEWLAAELDGLADCDFLVPFLRVNPTEPDAVREMERWKAAGFVGVKIHPEIQRFGLDEPGLDEFFAAAAELKLPVVTHTGVLHGRFPPSRYRPELFEPFLAGRPELVLILAHAGGAAYFRQVLALLQSYPNTYADLTGTLRPGKPWYIPPTDLYLVRDVGLRGRLIYGADWPWGGTEHVLADLEALRGMQFDAEERAGILGGTIARLVDISAVSEDDMEAQ
jgi:predicted TIM-barrel fold metal-dependent hydrolase